MSLTQLFLSFFQAAPYIGEIARYLLSTPESPQDQDHKVRVMFGNGLRPSIWADFKNRFNLDQIVEIYGTKNYCTGRLNGKNFSRIFWECHENSLIESFEMSPQLVCLRWHLRPLLWPASGSGLEVIWKWERQLRHIKWGLILKLSIRPFLSHHQESLIFFFHFMSNSLPPCAPNSLSL